MSRDEEYQQQLAALRRERESDRARGEAVFDGGAAWRNMMDMLGTEVLHGDLDHDDPKA